MSYLLETLGRGLLANLYSAFDRHFAEIEGQTIEQLAQRVRNAPTSTDANLQLATGYLRDVRLAEARPLFEQLLRRPEAAQRAALGLACVYDELGQFDRAIEYLTQAAELDPGDPAIAFGLGFCHERRGDTVAAVRAYRAAIDRCPNLRNAHERLAAMAARRSDWSTAAEHYRQLAVLDPADQPTLTTLGCLQLQQNLPAEAVETFQRALLIEPDAAVDEHDRADQADDRQLAEAIQAVESLVGKYPGVTEFQVRLGDLYVKAGDDQRAVRAYRSALELQPDFLEATIKLGTQHLRQERFAEAAQQFNKAVELNDRLLATFIGLAVAQRCAGHQQDAHAAADLAASLAPNSTLLFGEATRLHLRAESDSCAQSSGARLEPQLDEDDEFGETADDCEQLLHEALRRHEQALARNPNYADLHYRHGLLLWHIGDRAAALRAFRAAVGINPCFGRALVKLGMCLREQGQTDEAFEAFRRALLVRADDLEIHYQLALLFAQRSQFELTLDQMEMRADPNESAAIRPNLTLALQNIGMIDPVAASWRSICELTPPKLDLGDRFASSPSRNDSDPQPDA